MTQLVNALVASGLEPTVIVVLGLMFGLGEVLFHLTGASADVVIDDGGRAPLSLREEGGRKDERVVGLLEQVYRSERTVSPLLCIASFVMTPWYWAYLGFVALIYHPLAGSPYFVPKHTSNWVTAFIITAGALALFVYKGLTTIQLLKTGRFAPAKVEGVEKLQFIRSLFPHWRLTVGITDPVDDKRYFAVFDRHDDPGRFLDDEEEWVMYADPCAVELGERPTVLNLRMIDDLAVSLLVNTNGTVAPLSGGRLALTMGVRLAATWFVFAAPSGPILCMVAVASYITVAGLHRYVFPFRPRT